MTKSKIAASAKLATLLTAATGMVWEVDLDSTAGEAVYAPTATTTGRDWSERPSVMRNGWNEVWLNPNHPDRSQCKRLGMHKGAGWQAKVVPAVVHAYGKVPS